MKQKQFALFITFLVFLTINFSFAADQYTPAQLNVLKAQAINKNIKAIQKLNFYYFQRKDYKQAYKYIEMGVALGDPTSIADKGLYLSQGFGVVKKNYKEAIKLLQVGAQHNSPDALNSLGLIYAYGKGVKENPELARQYYEKAIDLGSDNAKYNLAMLILNHGSTKLAFEMFQALARYKNMPKAMLTVGGMYQFGAGVAKNYPEAYKWYAISKKEGYNPGAEQLNSLIKLMTPEQIAEGKKLVAEYHQQPVSQ